MGRQSALCPYAPRGIVVAAAYLFLSFAAHEYKLMYAEGQEDCAAPWCPARFTPDDIIMFNVHVHLCTYSTLCRVTLGWHYHRPSPLDLPLAQ
jgi:hypothetical protein